METPTFITMITMHHVTRLICCCLFCTWGSLMGVHAQDLAEVVQDLRPALYLNNMNNERIYQQTLMGNNHLVFSQKLHDRSTDQRAESYHYHFLRSRQTTYVLECRFHHHAVPITTVLGLEVMPFYDFGIQLYVLEEGVWKEQTTQLLPSDFEEQLLKQFIGLHASGRAYFYYNQVPEQLVEVLYQRRKLQFKAHHKTVLSLQWKHNRFVWRHCWR